MNTNLKAMLVFAKKDHAQPPHDKPHIHQAFDNLRDRGIWTRLNPDYAYSRWCAPVLTNGATDNPALLEPANWMNIEAWGYDNSIPIMELVYPEYAGLAAIAEMADRCYLNVWISNLSTTLVTAVPP